MSLFQQPNIGGYSLTEVTTNVEMFNGLSMDRSKQAFKDCIGDEFPYDVVDSVQKYATKLSQKLNSSLDDVLCGAAITDTNQEFNDIINSVSDAYDKFGTDPIFGSKTEEDLYKINGLGTDKIISSNAWVKSWSKSNFTKPVTTGTFINEIKTGDILADNVSITIKPSVSIVNKNLTTGSISVNINITNLRRGPNDGSSKTKDGTNILESVSGSFSYTGKITTKDTTQLIFDSQKCVFSGDSNISCTIQANIINVNASSASGNYTDLEPDFVVYISDLTYKGCWSDISTSLTSAQKGEIDDIYNSVKDNIKDRAYTTLKSEFMTSSLANEIINDKLSEYQSAYPALSEINTSELSQNIKNNLADNAIAIAEGGEVKLDSSFKKNLATSITTSAVNNELKNMGVDGNITTNCTKDLLSKLGGYLGDAADYLGLSDIDLGIEAPDIDLGLGDLKFGKLKDYIPFDASSVISEDILTEINNRFGKLMSSDCIKTINNTFDICDNQIASVAGGLSDLANSKASASSVAKDAASKYIKI